MARPIQKFERFYAKGDFSLAGSATAVTTTAFQRVGSLTVGAQTEATFGAGAIANGVDFRRNIVMDFKDNAGTPANIDNMRVRLVITNAQETRRVVVAEELSQNLRSGVALGEYPIRALQDDKLLIEVLPASNVTIGTTTSVSIPTTIYQ